jgi:lipopolysaccharide/colanic/teichoic acid biosynthesis glycosyltransferase
LEIFKKTRIDEFPQFINILKGDMGDWSTTTERPFVKEIAKIMPL